MQLVEVDGILQWEDVTDAPPRLGRLRRSGGAATADDGAIADIEFEKLPPSKITEFLAGHDQRFNKTRGLRRWDPKTGRLVPADAPKSGQMLLLVHGIFSNCDHFVDELKATPHGQKFLAEASKRYRNQVYVFDHATLSVGPLLNAIDLNRLFVDSKAEIDVVSHSRGGLVARWWCEQIHPSRCRNVIMVGSPLAGTGLAAPPNLRNTILLLTHFGDALGTAAGLASAAAPIFAVVESLLRVVASVTRWTAKTPVIDGVIAMVPGLFAMSRVGNNPELERLLRQSPVNGNQYFAITSNFEPDSPGWAFWRLFRKDRLAHVAADFVFDGENDLVVDTDSMTSLASKLGIPKSRTLSFKTSSVVHHLNYFQQAETITFLRKHLRI
jgi:pimeloyl-ACP methyl ester carboxylesterase